MKSKNSYFSPPISGRRAQEAIRSSTRTIYTKRNRIGDMINRPMSNVSNVQGFSSFPENVTLTPDELLRELQDIDEEDWIMKDNGIAVSEVCEANNISCCPMESKDDETCGETTSDVLLFNQNSMYQDNCLNVTPCAKARNENNSEYIHENYMYSEDIESMPRSTYHLKEFSTPNSRARVAISNSKSDVISQKSLVESENIEELKDFQDEISTLSATTPSTPIQVPLEDGAKDHIQDTKTITLISREVQTQRNFEDQLIGDWIPIRNHPRVLPSIPKKVLQILGYK